MFKLGSALMIVFIAVGDGEVAYPDAQDARSLLLDNFSRSDDQLRVSTRWEGFTDRDMLGRASPDISRLRSVVVVAGKADFAADIQVRSIELYK